MIGLKFFQKRIDFFKRATYNIYVTTSVVYNGIIFLPYLSTNVVLTELTFRKGWLKNV